MPAKRIQPASSGARIEKVPGHPGIFRKGDRYYDTWKERGRSRKKAYRTLTAAVKGRAERIAAGGAAPSRERFDRYAKRWLVEYQGRKAEPISQNTRDRYAMHMRLYAIPYFKKTPIGDLTPLDVRKFLEHLQTLEPLRPQRGATRLAPATIVSIMGAVKAMLAEAYELGLTRTDVGRVRVVVRGAGGRRRRSKPKTLTRSQLRALLAELDSRDRLLFYFLGRTGLRISEALGVKWRDLRHTPDGLVLVLDRQAIGGELTDEGKTENALRTVAILPSLARMLTRHRSSTDYAASDHPVFASLTGSHQDDHNVRRRLRPAAKRASVPWATPHVFRHTLATELRDSGVHDTIIAAVLGHSDPNFTRRTYMHTEDAPRFDHLDDDGLTLALEAE